MPASKRSTGPGLSSLIREAGQQARAVAEERPEPVITQVPGQDELIPVMVPSPRRRQSQRIFNILEYIESSWGLGMRLYPVQRFIVKLYYFLPLDDKVQDIEISDMFNQRIVYRFTEVEYLKYLHKEGRCNIGEQDHERRELLLAIGRRGGKTTLSSIFASYEIYRLLNLQNPQDYYGLPGGDRIQIISVATDKDQAGILFNGVTTHLNRCEYFKQYIANNTLSYIQFRTPADIERYGQTVRHENGKFVSFMGKATLRVTFKSCIAKGLRGSGNIVIILDEMAHFKDQGQSSAKDIYDAITPSTAAYSPKNERGQPEGPVESRVICISSPLNKTGKFFELYHLAMTMGPGSENMIAIQAPTWEVNPTIESQYYRQRYHADPTVFMTEHGAQFSDRVRGWIERETDLMACVDPTLRPKDIGTPRYPHAMGIDVGLVGDGTSVVITHAEQRRFLEDGHIVDRDVIVLDYHELWVAGQDWRETNPHLDPKWCVGYARNLKEAERLDFDEIATWIANLTKRFYITEGIFDRWNGFPLEQSLHKRGLTQFKCEMFKRELSSTIYQTTKLMMFDKRLRLYDWPNSSTDPQKKHSPIIQELLTLQGEQASRNVVIVAAPQHPGYHDDVSDALVRSIYLSAQRLSGQNRTMGPGMNGYAPAAPAPMTSARYQLMRARKHGGYGDRHNPRGMGLRRR